MLQQFAKSIKCEGFDFLTILELVMQFIQSCSKTSASAVRSGKLGVIARASGVARAMSATGCSREKARALVDEIFAKAVAAQQNQAPTGKGDWCDQMAAAASLK